MYICTWIYKKISFVKSHENIHYIYSYYQGEGPAHLFPAPKNIEK